MWGIARITPSFEMSSDARYAAGAILALVGAILAISGALTLRRVKTTVNPMKPQDSSTFVDRGIFRYTRNPMYLGLLFVLVAWTVFLSAPWAFVGPLAFVLYMNRFQIVPEERVLSQLFGEAYAEYKMNVRRWL